APRPRQRIGATNPPSFFGSRVGWTTRHTLPPRGLGPELCPSLPASVECSTQAHQARWLSTEVPARMVPSGRWTGLFLIGPSRPAGRASASDQVLPPSAERRVKAVQLIGLGPAL